MLPGKEAEEHNWKVKDTLREASGYKTKLSK
jgi:hypothetical protein